MAGHSKWANIKFRKSVQDAKRGKLFTKYIREITVAARCGGGDPEANPRLRTAMDKALDANMTRDTVDRAIKRGVGGQEGQDLEELHYEGYGPGGVAVLVDCLTNNRKRTVSDVRHAFTKYGGNLGTEGSVSYLFEKKGQIIFSPGTSEETVMNIALEVGAEDVNTDEDGTVEVSTAFENFNQVRHAMEQAGLKPERAEIAMVPQNAVLVSDALLADKFIKMVDVLEDLDDVQAVYSNADIPEEFL